MNTTLKAQGMAFSRDAKYLVILGGLPDFRISIFDLEKKDLIKMEPTTLKSKEPIISISFNPKTKNEFCILTASFIYFYKILPAFIVSASAQDMEDGEATLSLDDAYRLEVREFSVANIPIGPEHEGNVHMTSLKWDPFGRIHLCTNTPKLYQINPSPRETVKRDDQQDRKPLEPKIEQELTLDSIPMTTLLTQRHMIVSQEDGIISWYKIDFPPHDPTQDVKITLESEIEKEYPISDYLGDN